MGFCRLKNIMIQKGSGGEATTPAQLNFDNKEGQISKFVGGEANTLGKNWTGADIKSPNLRVKFQLDGLGWSDLYQIFGSDYVRLKVWHQPPPQIVPAVSTKSQVRTLTLEAAERKLSFIGGVNE